MYLTALFSCQHFLVLVFWVYFTLYMYMYFPSVKYKYYYGVFCNRVINCFHITFWLRNEQSHQTNPIWKPELTKKETFFQAQTVSDSLMTDISMVLVCLVPLLVTYYGF